MIQLIQTHGMKELEQRLKALPTDLEKKVIKQAVFDACKIVRDEARAAAPVAVKPHWLKLKKAGIVKGTVAMGYLKKKGVIISMNPKDINRYTEGVKFGKVTALIGFARSAWYGFLIERGWIATGRKSKGVSISQHRRTIKSRQHGWKHIPGRPFLRPAFQRNVVPVIELFRIRLNKYLEKQGA
jgi:HK97 gp10 family phage protein